jgi:hypothetical protein
VDDLALWVVVAFIICVVAIVARWNAKSRAANSGVTKIDARNVSRGGGMDLI